MPAYHLPQLWGREGGGVWVDEEWHARALVSCLSAAELDALRGLVAGESLNDLATRRSVDTQAAADVRDALRWKLGVTRDAEAVGIALTAGL